MGNGERQRHVLKMKTHVIHVGGRERERERERKIKGMLWKM
jgi:hypothetical protein